MTRAIIVPLKKIREVLYIKTNYMKAIGIFFLMLPLVVNAQSKRGEYCSCKEAIELNNPANYYPDSLYVTYHQDTATITVNIINTTKDTLYIFNSYFQSQFLNSKYLHRIIQQKKTYKVSFLPIIPYVFTKYSDVVVTTDEALIGNHQVVYDFYKLPPNSSQQIEFSYQELFKNRNKSNNVSKDYDVKKLNKNSRPSQSFYTTSKLKGKYHFEFEFAVYKSVYLLCNQTAYYLQEYKFDKQSKDFKVITVPAKINFYSYSLL
jgi:hypothetical protein